MLVVLSTLIEYNVSRFHEASHGAVYKAEHFAVFSVPEEGAKEGLSAELGAVFISKVTVNCSYFTQSVTNSTTK